MIITPELTEDIVFDLVISENEFPVDFDLAWRWLEFSRKQNAKESLINCGFIENIDFRVFHRFEVEKKVGEVRKSG
jgi:hypothetical protein